MAIKTALPGLVGSCGVSGVVATGCYAHSSGLGSTSVSQDAEESGVSSSDGTATSSAEPQTKVEAWDSSTDSDGTPVTRDVEVPSAEPKNEPEVEGDSSTDDVATQTRTEEPQNKPAEGDSPVDGATTQSQPEESQSQPVVVVSSYVPSAEDSATTPKAESEDPSQDQLQSQVKEETSDVKDAAQISPNTESDGEPTDSQHSIEASGEDKSRSEQASSCGWFGTVGSFIGLAKCK